MTEIKQKNKNRRVQGLLRQIQTTLACSLGAGLAGVFGVWPSYTLGIYRSPNMTVLSVPMNDVESSLVGSLPSLGAMVGTLISGLLIDRIGRRNGGVVVSLPYVICWGLLEVSTSSTVILIARCIGGLSSGAFLVLSPVFITEMANHTNRGILTSVIMLFNGLGMTTSYLLGWFTSYYFIIRFNLICSIICVISMGLVIESPVYFAKKGRKQDTLNAIAQYRGASTTSKVVQNEFNSLKGLFTTEQELLPTKDSGKPLNENESVEKGYMSEKKIPKKSAIQTLFISPASRRAFIMIAAVLALQTFMGVSPIQIYAKDVFGKAAPNLSSHFCSVLLSLVLVCGSIVNAAAIEKVGRRWLLIFSILATSICMAILGVLLQFDLSSPWLVAVVLLTCCLLFNSGASMVPFLLAAEIFPPEVKTVASVIINQMVWLFTFFIVSVFPFITKYLGIYGACYIFACIGGANAILCYLKVPETGGLSIEQIQEFFLKR